MSLKPILIAEDSDQDIEMLLRALDVIRIKNPVQILKDGQQAIDYLDGKGAYADRTKFPIPGILLLDLMMPKKDGLEVLRHVGALPHYSDMLVVVLTGLTENHYIDKAYQAGAHSFLRKPARIDELQNLVAFFDNFWTVEGVSKQQPFPLTQPSGFSDNFDRGVEQGPNQQLGL